MGRLRYAVPEDVVRLALGATIARANQSTIADALDVNDLLGTEDDREYLITSLEGSESRWDREATPMRAVSVGSESVPKYYSAKGKPWPIRLFLDHQNIHPIDQNMGDFLELRTGRDQYRDATTEEGTVWTADYDRGIITVHRAPGRGQLPAFYRIRDKFLKISYHISAGGDFTRSGETTLTESMQISDGTGTFNVTNAERLPESGEPFLVGGSEYVYVSEVDHENDTITVGERGVRFTADADHSSGATIHFCPLDVREAVALMAAIRLTQSEDFTEAMFDGDVDRGDKMDRWNEEINRTIANYTDQGGYS